MKFNVARKFPIGVWLLWMSMHAHVSAAQNEVSQAHYFLPNATASEIITLSSGTTASASVIIVTQALAIKETGPALTVKKFGEVYGFSPSFISVEKDRPTRLEFWNLQPDDTHQFFIVGPKSESLLFVELPPLKKTSYVLTFHKEGLYSFQCPMHGAAMSGQIMVVRSEMDAKREAGFSWKRLWAGLKNLATE